IPVPSPLPPAHGHKEPLHGSPPWASPPPTPPYPDTGCPPPDTEDGSEPDPHRDVPENHTLIPDHPGKAPSLSPDTPPGIPTGDKHAPPSPPNHSSHCNTSHNIPAGPLSPALPRDGYPIVPHPCGNSPSSDPAGPLHPSR